MSHVCLHLSTLSASSKKYFPEYKKALKIALGEFRHTLGYVPTTNDNKTAGRYLEIDLKGILGVLVTNKQRKQHSFWQVPQNI